MVNKLNLFTVRASFLQIKYWNIILEGKLHGDIKIRNVMNTDNRMYNNCALTKIVKDQILLSNSIGSCYRAFLCTKRLLKQIRAIRLYSIDARLFACELICCE